MPKETSGKDGEQNNLFEEFFDLQKGAMQEMMTLFGAETDGSTMPASQFASDEWAQWSDTANQLQTLWLSFLTQKAQAAPSSSNIFDPSKWMMFAQSMAKALPKPPLEEVQKAAGETMAIWQSVLGGLNQDGVKQDLGALPRDDPRFADPAWHDNPGFALLHQTYLMLADHFLASIKNLKGVDAANRKQLEFAAQSLIDALSPDNFMLTNPVVIERILETKGQNLVRGMRHLITDLERGQLTHSDPDAFTLGENLAATPGKVVHETPLFQLIQYTPTTKDVLDVPLVIFPPWINRYYILDLTPKKSFIKWAIDQGITVFVVSWKSADSSMKDVVWDDYISSQITAIDHVCARLDVPSVHTIGYCVAGTTLAATLAVLARRGEADKVKSATYFTAQVDFERSGELKNFIEDGQLQLIDQLSDDGYLDGRFLAATFNSLRSKDLIWNYVVNNYLLGEDYPAFDLLHWNGDVTNLPSKWHHAYLRDLYRDNKLVQPDALEADGTPIDLTKITTPSFIQAGREDHIAPAHSVWRATQHYSGPVTFMLAGSGHIAGVVNPPSAGKYQYWVGDSSAPSLDDFVAGAKEHPGSWWPYWLEWLEGQDGARSPVKGKRKPGGRNDPVIEDAPGRYVKTR